MIKSNVKKKDDIKNSEELRVKRKDRKKDKEKLEKLLFKIFGKNVKSGSFDWLTTTSLLKKHKNIYCAIKQVKGKDFLPKEKRLSCDYVIENKKIIIEYDESQHFTKQRLKALEAYGGNVCLYFDKETWINLCKKEDRQMNNKPQRDERRALYDSTRDIMAFEHKYKLIRIYHGEIDFDSKEAEEIIKQKISIK